jgi:hypothetical protein
MTRLTKNQQQEFLLEEFRRRLQAAPPGVKVFMPVGDLFQPAVVHDLDEWRTVRQSVDDDDGEDTSR